MHEEEKALGNYLSFCSPPYGLDVSISIFEVELQEKLKEKADRDSASKSATGTSADGFQASERPFGPQRY